MLSLFYDSISSELSFFELQKDVQNMFFSLEGKSVFYFEAEHEIVSGCIRTFKKDKFGRKADTVSQRIGLLLEAVQRIIKEASPGEKSIDPLLNGPILLLQDPMQAFV